MKVNIPRENVIDLMKDIRNAIFDKIDLKRYFDADMENLLKSHTEDEQIFQGISNEYLSELMSAIFNCDMEVVGDESQYFVCPCCGLKTLTEIYSVEDGTGYDICPYCNWEDDGTVEMDRYSSVNQGSMREYRTRIKEQVNNHYIPKWIEK